MIDGPCKLLRRIEILKQWISRLDEKKYTIYKQRADVFRRRIISSRVEFELPMLEVGVRVSDNAIPVYDLLSFIFWF